MSIFGTPKPPKPPPTPPPAKLPDGDPAELARQQRALNAQRKGYSSLRIDPATQTPVQSGLNIPAAL